MSRANFATTHQNAGIAAWRFNSQAKINSYAEAKAFLGRENERKLGTNMAVVRVHSRAIGIRLYNTIIITYYSNGTFEADNGGWATPTTTTRLNYFAPPGWCFGHGKRKLYGNGRLMGPGKRYPVQREKLRLEELRAEIQAERISYGELAELQDLVEFIEPGDVQLLEWAGVPEFPEES